MSNDANGDDTGAALRRENFVGGLRAAISTHREKSEPTTEPPRPRLGQVLMRNGYISDEEINRALAAQARSGKLIGEILIEQGAVTRPIVSRALEEQEGSETQNGFFSGLRDALGKTDPTA